MTFSATAARSRWRHVQALVFAYLLLASSIQCTILTLHMLWPLAAKVPGSSTDSMLQRTPSQDAGKLWGDFVACSEI